MKTFSAMLLCLLMLFSGIARAQETELLRTIVSTYYKTEKPIYKGRSQLLFFFCEKANNNEELYETIGQLKLSSEETKKIKKQISDMAPKNWQAELQQISSENPLLFAKINSCLSLDEFHTRQQTPSANNRRLLIVSKPLYFGGNRALVKIVFYRSSEHNNGSVLLMEKSADGWIIKESLNSWST